VRRFWRATRAGARAGVASHRLERHLRPERRRTYASVNFVTCHDGFTLTDLVSYEQRHNEANGGDSNDGAQENNSRNWGVEGRRSR